VYELNTAAVENTVEVDRQPTWLECWCRSFWRGERQTLLMWGGNHMRAVTRTLTSTFIALIRSVYMMLKVPSFFRSHLPYLAMYLLGDKHL
jgi:hypothetical protein